MAASWRNCRSRCSSAVVPPPGGMTTSGSILAISISSAGLDSRRDAAPRPQASRHPKISPPTSATAVVRLAPDDFAVTPASDCSICRSLVVSELTALIRPCMSISAGTGLYAVVAFASASIARRIWSIKPARLA